MYTGDKLVGDVFQLADALEVAEFTIVGHDWGGAIAWGVAAAGQSSGRVTRAVIANAPHPALFPRLLWTDPRQRAASQYIRAFRDPANDELIRRHGLAGLLFKAVRWERPPALEPEERAALLADWQDPEAAFGMVNWYRAARLDVPSPDAPYEMPADRAPAFPPIAVPTLVVWGMDDEALPPANLEGLGECVTDLKIVEVPGCGHFVPWEAPETVNRAIDRFLERTAGLAPG